ncbi:hypothetical protein ACTHPH_24045 [Paenibacillus pasadenensis]|uniref:hypothetical protein n=1 Tax=Paenibacillus pasadenensis TaxID=217090 RepID=UPI0004114419|nr:hypothetical protein [Paenibacillus pasadenensis]
MDTFSIGESFSPAAINLFSLKAPALSTRPGFSIVGGPIGARVLGLAAWKNRELHAVFADGTWRKLNGVGWDTLKSGLNPSLEWSFANFKGGYSDTNLIGVNGANVMQRYDGTSVQDLANAPSGANYVDQHDNRLYVAIDNRVAYSGLNVADEWTIVGRPNDSSPGMIRKETYVGENIVGIKSGAGHATVFFPSSSWELYGTSPSDFAFVSVAEDIGCVNDQSITNLGGVMYFLSESGIYTYSGGVRPSKAFSQPVQAHIDGMVKAALKYCCMGSDGRFLYVAIPTQSTTNADTILVWDSQEKSWWIWKGISPTHMLKMGETLYMADAQGRVLRMGGATDAGQPINWEWQSKTFTAESMAMNLRWLRMWWTIEKPAGSYATIYLSKEPEADSGWVSVGSINEAALANKRIPITPFQMALSPYLRTKISGSGPVTIRELAWDQKDLPAI